MSKAEVARVELTDSVDIRAIGEARQRMVDAFGRGAPIEIDLAGVSDVDLTGLQLIESARKTAAQRGLGIRLSAPAPGPVLETLRRGGFLTGDAARLDFWTARQGGAI
jgi:anti-anti-sigma regulatory factor